MDQNLKNRLVGAGVLLALAVIFLPLLFDGANQQALMGEMRLPTPPEVPQAQQLLEGGGASELPAMREEVRQAHAPASVEPEIAPTVAEQAGAASDEAGAVATPAPVAPASAAPVQTDPRLANLAEAWDVQVAAGSSREGASRLLVRLETAGYKARIRHDGEIYRVVVGPVLRREDAVSLRTALAADARVDKPQGLLVRYIP